MNGHRYYIVEHDGDLYRFEVQDTLTGQRLRNAQGFTARFLTDEDARAAVPADQTDPTTVWG